jgi:sulfur carrier protein ThiS
MKIRIKILPDNSTKEIDLSPGSSVSEVLKKIQLRPDTVIVLKGNTPIPIDDTLNQEEELHVLKVASGG